MNNINFNLVGYVRIVATIVLVMQVAEHAFPVDVEMVVVAASLFLVDIEFVVGVVEFFVAVVHFVVWSL